MIPDVIDPQNLHAQHQRAKIKSAERRTEMLVVKFEQSKCYGIMSMHGYKRGYLNNPMINPIARYVNGRQEYLPR